MTKADEFVDTLNTTLANLERLKMEGVAEALAEYARMYPPGSIPRAKLHRRLWAKVRYFLSGLRPRGWKERYEDQYL